MFIVKFAVIVVLVYVATSLVNEDEYNISFFIVKFPAIGPSSCLCCYQLGE